MIFPIPPTSPCQIDLFLWRRIVRRKQNGSIHHSVCLRPRAINNTLLVVSESACWSPVQFKAITTNKQNGTTQLISYNTYCYLPLSSFPCSAALGITPEKHLAGAFIWHSSHGTRGDLVSIHQSPCSKNTLLCLGSIVGEEGAEPAEQNRDWGVEDYSFTGFQKVMRWRKKGIVWWSEDWQTLSVLSLFSFLSQISPSSNNPLNDFHCLTELIRYWIHLWLTTIKLHARWQISTVASQLEVPWFFLCGVCLFSFVSAWVLLNVLQFPPTAPRYVSVETLSWPPGMSVRVNDVCIHPFVLCVLGWWTAL